MSQAVGGTSNTTDMGGLTKGSSTLGKDEFLKLLITQFQYQDPLNPLEDKEFIAQLAQFSSLEQSMLTNENMAALLDSQERQTSVTITNYIGKEVSARGYQVSLKEGKASAVQFAAAENLATCVVNIIDGSDNIVRTIDLGARPVTTGGPHELLWDGKTSSGTIASDGVYLVSFVGTNEAGERTFVDSSISGKVIGTSLSNGTYWLRLDDGRNVEIDEVRETLTTDRDEEIENTCDPSDNCDPEVACDPDEPCKPPASDA